MQADWGRARAGRRRRLLSRTLPIAAVAIAAFVLGAIVATGPGRAERALVGQYVRAWERGRYDEMYGLLDAASRRQYSEAGFAQALASAAATGTLQSLRMVSIGHRSGDAIPVRMTVNTRIFGSLRTVLLVTLHGSGSAAHVHFGGTLLFPGLRSGEQLTRQVTLPPRAAVLARDGTPLAEGPTRSSPIPDVASQIAGTVGPIPPTYAYEYAAEGYPPGAIVGLDGLERAFQDRLAGRLGGTLLAGSRVLAQATPQAAPPVRTSISPALERDAVAALAGRYGGIAAMDPRSGELLALAGVAFSALQPPGSTMKIITASGALEAGIVKLTDTFPVQSSTTLDGFNLQNANGEYCGGTLLEAFANSCNSVFAPLGARLGAARLVNIAERFGFNQAPAIPGAAEPTIPSAASIGDDLAVGSSAIGQGMVQSTALEMTDVGATIAMRGRRPIPTLLAGSRPRFVHVISGRVAGLLQRMMIAVVQFGTGTAAQIPGVTVAGKTGTAELRNTTNPNDPNANSAKNTDAWFVGYAPAGAPRIVVGALFPEQGAGGATAAPAAHDVLAAALKLP